MAERNVIIKYDCINRNWWRIPIQRIAFERFTTSSKYHCVGHGFCENLQPLENFEQ
jgi:hypothetical protein